MWPRGQFAPFLGCPRARYGPITVFQDGDSAVPRDTHSSALLRLLHRRLRPLALVLLAPRVSDHCLVPAACALFGLRPARDLVSHHCPLSLGFAGWTHGLWRGRSVWVWSCGGGWERVGIGPFGSGGAPFGLPNSGHTCVRVTGPLPCLASARPPHMTRPAWREGRFHLMSGTPVGRRVWSCAGSGSGRILYICDARSRCQLPRNSGRRG